MVGWTSLWKYFRDTFDDDYEDDEVDSLFGYGSRALLALNTRLYYLVVKLRP